MISQDQKLLLIGGQPKAGTSSLHFWLSAHPQIAASKVKETRFFLEKTYPLPGTPRFDGSNLQQYAGFFDKDCADRTLLDSSPDYLYSPTALEIPRHFPNARILFILRDPVDRSRSWYRFSASIGRIGRNVSFEEFVESQFDLEVTEKTPLHLRMLEQNRTDKYLPRFREAFGPDNVLVLDFEELKRDPRALVEKVCKFGGLDASFFDDFDFTRRNETRAIHASRLSRLYYRTRAWVLYRFKPSPAVAARLRPPARAVKRLISGGRKLEMGPIPEDLERRIVQAARR